MQLLASEVSSDYYAMLNPHCSILMHSFHIYITEIYKHIEMFVVLVLATSKTYQNGWVPICHSVHSL